MAKTKNVINAKKAATAESKDSEQPSEDVVFLCVRCYKPVKKICELCAARENGGVAEDESVECECQCQREASDSSDNEEGGEGKIIIAYCDCEEPIPVQIPNAESANAPNSTKASSNIHPSPPLKPKKKQSSKKSLMSFLGYDAILLDSVNAGLQNVPFNEVYVVAANVYGNVTAYVSSMYPSVENIFIENHNLTTTGKSGGDLSQVNTDKLKMMFEANLCLTRTDLNVSAYGDFIEELAGR